MPPFTVLPLYAPNRSIPLRRTYLTNARVLGDVVAYVN